jgi:hypothetical protein
LFVLLAFSQNKLVRLASLARTVRDDVAPEKHPIQTMHCSFLKKNDVPLVQFNLHDT